MPRLLPLATLWGLFVWLSTSSAWAALGASPGAIQIDGQAVAGEVRAAAAQGYSIVETVSPDIVVREYVSPAGAVFAVSWTGRRSPDLPALLAAYFVEYETALAGREGRPSRPRGTTRLETAHLVVEEGGHMGAIWGKAYLPSQLPPGVKPEAIQ